MKKYFFLSIIVALFLSQTVNAQTVNDIPLKDIDVEYVQIVGTAKLMSNKVTIGLEFGQLDKVWSSKDTQIKDEHGNKLVFNSMIDALNFMSKHGYEFVQAYAFTVGNQNVYHYLMRKETP